MTIDEMAELFNRYESCEYLAFDRVANKLSKRHDLHAFIVLDKLFPDDYNIIECASHDEIYLSVNVEEFAEVATEELIIELVRCGVFFDGYSFNMYV